MLSFVIFDRMWQSILYQLVLVAFSLFAFPKYLYQMVRMGKYRGQIAARLGRKLPPFERNGRFVIWIHAVSVGEIKAAQALAKMLKKEGERALVISSVTETGHEEAKKSLPFADAHFFLPFDFPFAIRRAVKHFSPNLLLLSEGDLWPNFLRYAKKSGAKVAIINAKISLQSFRRMRSFSPYPSWLFRFVDRIAAQNSCYAERFAQLGLQEKTVVTGNTKLDMTVVPLTPAEKTQWRTRLALSEGDRLFVAGSTHETEEALLLTAFERIWERYPEMKLLLVPRHPERFDRVAKLIEERGIAHSRLSRGEAVAGSQVILVDAMGVLLDCYQLADIALVGGSFNGLGGHNIIEPCFFSVPVLFGPDMQAQLGLVALVQQYHAGLQLSKKGLAEQLLSFLDHPKKQKELGEGGRRLVAAQRGATRRTLAAIEFLLN